MRTVGIVGNGPLSHLPDLDLHKQEIDVWIGADRGVLTLIDRGIDVDYAVGDFDSIDANQKDIVQQKVDVFEVHPAEKDMTDLEIALQKAFHLDAGKIYMFGVTGGRLDHALINIQLLYSIISKNINGVIIDKWNQVEMVFPGTYTVKKSSMYPYISFVTYTKDVKNLRLNGFYYPLVNADITWGSTRCISNELFSNEGKFSFDEGILLFIKSRDVSSDRSFI